MPLGIAGVVFGLAGTLASAYIYLVKARPAWNMIHTPLDFLLSAALMGSVLPAVLRGPAEALGDAAARFGMHLQHRTIATHVGLTAAVAVAWCLNQVLRIARLRASGNFESRASYNLLRGEALWWRVALALLAAGMTPVFLAAPLPVPALLTAVVAVSMGRYLFFVSVVPLSMGLTFLGGKRHGGAVQAGAHA